MVTTITRYVNGVEVNSENFHNIKVTNESVRKTLCEIRARINHDIEKAQEKKNYISTNSNNKNDVEISS